MRLTLLLGGARSGKSRRALALARSYPGEVVFLATARADDDDADWQARIARHRRERPRHWPTIEAPDDLPQAVRRAARDGRLLVIDCLGVWLANRLLAGAPLAEEADAIVAALRDGPGSSIVVSNEVGMGVVPPYPSGRAFRDALGSLHQRLAAMAERVELVVAGLPWVLKANEGGCDDDRADR